MGSVNSETVVMMGAALVGAGQVQAQDERQTTDEKTISWDEAQRKTLIAELKEQCAGMSDKVHKLLETYNVDQLREVKETLKLDGQKLSYVLDGDQYSLSGGSKGEPLNVEFQSKDGLKVEYSQGSVRTSMIFYDEQDNSIASIQDNKKIDSSVLNFQGEGYFDTISMEDDRIDAHFKSEDGDTYVAYDGNNFSTIQQGSEVDSYINGKFRKGHIVSTTMGFRDKQDGSEMHLQGQFEKDNLSVMHVRESDSTESEDYTVDVSRRGNFSEEYRYVDKVNGDVERKSVSVSSRGDVHKEYVKENAAEGEFVQLKVEKSRDGAVSQKYRKEDEYKVEESSFNLSKDGNVRDVYKYENKRDSSAEYFKEETSRYGDKHEEYKSVDQDEKYRSRLDMSHQGNVTGEYKYINNNIGESEIRAVTENGHAYVKEARETLKAEIEAMRRDVFEDDVASENINDESWKEKVFGTKTNVNETCADEQHHESNHLEMTQTPKQIIVPTRIKQNCPIKQNQESQSHILNVGYEYSDVQINRIELEDGAYKSVTEIDHKKHGAEIFYDKQNNIKDVKMYNMGQMLDNKQHRIEIKSESKDDIEHQYVLLDGRKFGTETFMKDSIMAATFYQENGVMMSRDAFSTVSYNEQQLPNYGKVNADSVVLKQEVSRSVVTDKAHDEAVSLSAVDDKNKGKNVDSGVSYGRRIINEVEKGTEVNAAMLKAMMEKRMMR